MQVSSANIMGSHKAFIARERALELTTLGELFNHLLLSHVSGHFKSNVLAFNA
jgi:hypothetical protein